MKEFLSKDEIREAFLLWEKAFKANPDDFTSEAEELELTSEELAEMDVDALFDYHKKVKK